METWRIAIPVVVFILCIIGAWYVIRLRLEEIRYPKTGHKYMPLYRCRMKTGEWLDALIYQGMSKLYVREHKDFFDKFVKLLDWENEKVSANRESGKS